MTWWNEPDQYTRNVAIPAALMNMAGPNGLAVVDVFEDGKTSPGWGSQFMERYDKKRFSTRRLGLSPTEPSNKSFAVVMRSVKAICIDIDGKNGGLDGVKKLGLLPRTLAETSKSGNGYHLFYRTSDTWDDEQGFARFTDRISLVDGVDIRATGCVYHYPNQRWNYESMVPLPPHLVELLRAAKSKRDAEAAAIASILNSNDPVEVAMTHAELIEDLGKPIASGKRNNTLFAIGSKMKLAGVPNWDNLVADRATQVGLDQDETNKLVSNIIKYA